MKTHIKKSIHLLTASLGLATAHSVWAQSTFNASLFIIDGGTYKYGSTYAGPVVVPGNSLSTSTPLDFNFTITSSQIDIVLVTTATPNFIPGFFNGIVLNEVTGDPITYAALNAASTFPGLTANDITFNTSQININLAELMGSNGNTIIVDLTPTPTPEPSTLALASLGGLGMLWQLCRRK